jgi:hypothetical protein
MLTRQKGKNHYQGVFGEIYRHFGVTSYTHIPLDRYADVLAFLEDWRTAAMKGKQLPDGEEQ